MSTQKIALSLTIIAAGLLAQNVRAQVVVTIEKPGVQHSSVPNITTETFDGFAPGVYTSLVSNIGTYSSPGEAIVSANQYGGAGGAGNYYSIGAQSGQLTSTLTLPANEAYFGFWYSAGDNQNAISLYENNTLVYNLDTQSLISFINTQPNSSSYYSNPNNGQDSGEPFAYVNFFGTHGTVFNKIVFTNASLATGFESDNHSISPTQTGPTGTPITPEPGTFAMLVGMGISGAAFLRRKRVSKPV